MPDEQIDNQITFINSRRWERTVTLGLIVIGLALVIFFGGRTVVAYIRIQQTGLQAGVTNVEAIRGWMTVPYIAQAYGIPEEALFQAIEVPPAKNRDKSLGQLNRTFTPGELGVILARVKTTIQLYFGISYWRRSLASAGRAAGAL